jgi:hypothetical protein
MHAADSPQQLIYTVLFLHGPHHRAKFWEVEKPNKDNNILSSEEEIMMSLAALHHVRCALPSPPPPYPQSGKI